MYLACNHRSEVFLSVLYWYQARDTCDDVLQFDVTDVFCLTVTFLRAKSLYANCCIFIRKHFNMIYLPKNDNLHISRLVHHCLFVYYLFVINVVLLTLTFTSLASWCKTNKISLITWRYLNWISLKVTLTSHAHEMISSLSSPCLILTQDPRNDETKRQICFLVHTRAIR